MNIHAPESRASDPAPMRMVYPTDTVGKAIIYSLEPPQGGAFAEAIGQQGPEVGWWVAALWFVLVAIVNIAISWYTGASTNMSYYWSSIVDALLAQIFIIWGIWYTRHEASTRPDGVRTPTQISVRSLRRAALAGDDNLAPPVTNFGVAPAALQPNTETTTVSVLPTDWRLLRRARITIGICLGICALLSVVFTGDENWLWGLLGLVLPLFIFCVWLLIPIIRRSRPFRVEVRTDGLHWRHHTLPWSEVHGWFTLSLNLKHSGWTHPNVVYAVVGQHTSLMWLAYPEEVDSQDRGNQLARLVQAHMTLSLRDLTPSAIHISGDVGSWPFDQHARLVAINDRYMLAGNLPRLPAALLTFSFVIVVLLAGILTPYGQQWYFGRQLGQLEASRSALHDPLTSNALHWTPGASYYNAKSFAFTLSGYVVSGDSCCDLSSLIAQPVSDGLVEVTVRQQSRDDFSDAGILFRADTNRHTAFAFVLDLGGYWRLSRYTIGADGALSDEQFLNSGATIRLGQQLIHRGRDVTNRLAVLMQGSMLTFFINGQYVGRYQVSALPQSGQVGIYADSFESALTFSDLLISPA